ncbi:G8 domain-containing protein [Rubrobacter indicoceani]|uniref:G8 domain-containing protein n=1 Tax=Rubrobacter indicoceani TaxID=2051957 RepID=UPI000E5A7497|nr:G8 domain-containing protein [Rubrobacter indicoceani]
MTTRPSGYARDAEAGGSGPPYRLGVRLALLVATAIVLACATAASANPAGLAPKLTVSGQTAPGLAVRISGSGFPKSTPIEIRFENRRVAKVMTDRRGRFVRSWKIPANAATGTLTAKTAKPPRRAQTTVSIPAPGPEAPPPPTAEPAPEPVEDPQSGTGSSGTAERWSDAVTWGGAIPGAGEEVIVPAGKTVLLDRDTPALGGLTVNGTLRFADSDVTLTSGYVMVHGALEVGTREDPIETRARIVLTGSDRAQNIMGMGAKVLGVMGGTLDVHGEARSGWTRLGATAAAGSNTITLEKDPGWRVGDRIAIASTDFAPLQAEEATITAVSDNRLTLSRRLTYSHYGEKQSIAGGTVDERAEVALLSRNVVIEGEAASSADGFGGQLMVMDDGKLRMEGAELTRMGQRNILRRYPVHFHLLSNAGADSYLTNTTLHNTFNRCVTIHGTNGLRVAGNTCYNTPGHAFFLEDGAETDNVLEGNLGFVTRKPPESERLLLSDARPATFWITNPDNTLRGNVAAGSEGFGFWFALPENPTGLSRTTAIWPRRTPLGVFSGNTAHSNNLTGLFIDDGPKPDGSTTETTNYRPLLNPSDRNSSPVPAVFDRFTGYKNRERGIWQRGTRNVFTDAVLADNAIGATFASHETYLDGSLVVGETRNLGNTNSWERENGRVGAENRSLPMPWRPDFPIRGYEFYDGKVGTRGTTFADFQPNDMRQASALGMLLEDAFGVHPGNYTSGLRFVDARKLYLPGPAENRDGDRSLVFRDADGSLTGTAGSVLTANSPFLTREGCTKNADWNAYVCPPGLEHATLMVGTLGGSPTSIKPLRLTTEKGVDQTLNGCCDYSRAAETSVVVNEMYRVAYNGGTPTSERLQFVLRDGDTKNVIVQVPYAGTPKVLRWGEYDLGPAGPSWAQGVQVKSVAELRSANVQKSSYFYDQADRMLYIKIVARMPDPKDTRAVDWVDVQVVPG